jgi:hypothetical protein
MTIMDRIMKFRQVINEQFGHLISKQTDREILFKSEKAAQQVALYLIRNGYDQGVDYGWTDRKYTIYGMLKEQR